MYPRKPAIRKKGSASRLPEGARGQRAYIVGDIHGRLDLLDALLSKIHGEIERDGPSRVALIFVGDLIDRGPQSAQVIERLRTYRKTGVKLFCLLGNHEEVMLRVLDGEAGMIGDWLSFGGSECLSSYGIEPETLDDLDEAEILATIRRAIPRAHLKFLNECADTLRFGDYLVVHAGIRPGVELVQQRQHDLRWIRAPFLTDPSDHGVVVVHGHTITPTVDERDNRIGIDTGAYATGVLTALAIEGADRWYLSTAGGS